MSEEKDLNAGDSHFSDLGSFEAVKFQTFEKTGNVVKAHQVVSRGVRAIELHEGDEDHPSIVIHRDGEMIECLEFICKCGRGTSVKFQYDGE
jgi:hypothetical protein